MTCSEGRKPLRKDGIKMTERVAMACTKEEYDILIQAMNLSERRTMGEFLRGAVIPYARNIVTNHNLYKMSLTFSSPEGMGLFIQNSIGEENAEDQLAEKFLKQNPTIYQGIVEKFTKK